MLQVHRYTSTLGAEFYHLEVDIFRKTGGLTTINIEPICGKDFLEILENNIVQFFQDNASLTGDMLRTFIFSKCRAGKRLQLFHPQSHPNTPHSMPKGCDVLAATDLAS